MVIVSLIFHSPPAMKRSSSDSRSQREKKGFPVTGPFVRKLRVNASRAAEEVCIE